MNYGQFERQNDGGKGGHGGHASVNGESSIAQGGDGGDAVIGDGGHGGDARVDGNNSEARGGQGGRGGVDPGGRGGDAMAAGSNTFAVGGQGGEASQSDGRGGRGGRSYMPWLFGDKRLHMRLPYGEVNNYPGRGGDSVDTPQYKARRLIVENLKERYFRAKSLPMEDVWYDREIVGLDWLNERIKAEGHRWQVSLVDSEYEFTDLGYVGAGGTVL